MSEPIVSKGPASGSLQNTPEFQRTEKIQPITGTPAYSAAFNALASTPTALGELGATMAQSAMTQRLKVKGAELGKTPQGDLLPPISKADQVFADAYYSQAKVTLSQQAKEMTDKAQEDMNKSYSLSQGMINSYTKTMSQGYEDIIKQAPNLIKAELANSFANQLESSTHSYNMQMTSQQKERNNSASKAFITDMQDQVHSAILDGKQETAAQLNASINKTIDQNVGSGMWTPAQGQLYKTQSKLNYLTSTEVNNGLTAKANGTLESYVSQMRDRKPKDVSWSEWENVNSNTFKYLNTVQQYENQDQQLIMATAQNQMATQNFSAANLEDLKSTLTPRNFLTVSTQFAYQQKKATTGNNAVANLGANFSNPEAFNGVTKDVINKTYDAAVNQMMNKAQDRGHPMSLDEAQYQVAATAGRPIPKFIDGINNNAQYGNPVGLHKALNQYDKMHALSAEKLLGVNKESEAMIETFRGFLEQGYTDQDAAAMSKDVVFNKTEDIRKANNTKISEYFAKNAQTSQRGQSWAFGIANIDPSTVSNPTAVTMAVRRMFSENMQYTNGNIEVSKSMLEKGMAKSWGTTMVNGKKEYTFLPPEKAINISEGAAPLIQSDLEAKLRPQLDATNKAYEAGASQFYYRVKERISFDDYMTAKIDNHNLGFKDPRYAVNVNRMKEYEQGKPLEIEKVYKNKKVQSFTVNITTAPYAQLSPTTGQMLGDFDIGLINSNTKLPEPFIGFFGDTNILPVYRPDSKWIHDNYTAVVNVGGENITPQGYLDDLKQPHNIGEYRQMVRLGTLPGSQK